MTIDLNADVGESTGVYRYGDDLGVVPHVTSVNIACGVHAGDPGVMRETVALASSHGAAVGAHPGFPDLVGFGRREMHLSPRQVEDLVAYQIGALAGIAAAQGVRLRHVKPHGALYNMAARDRLLADAVARAVRSVDPHLILLGLAQSALVESGLAMGLAVAREGFADRGYTARGELVPRSDASAVVSDAHQTVERALSMVRDGAVQSVDGVRVPLVVDTLCVHGDTPGAAVLAQRLRQGLEQGGVRVTGLGRS